MDENKSMVGEFCKQVLISFAAALIAMSLVGWFVGDMAKEAGRLFALGKAGLSYYSIAQIFIFALAQTAIRFVVFWKFFSKKTMLLWKAMLMFIPSLVTAVILIIVFEWFPIASIYAWLGFIISISTGFLIIFLVMLAKTRIEDKKYNTMLSDYKSKHNKGENV